GRPHGHRPRAIQGEDEARLILLACSPVPEGYEHWTLRLLREKWVTLICLLTGGLFQTCLFTV
ncbi:MAG: hypothetical protein LBF95_06280, partial [Treponema sp.]|nr:hypothetical protein [Treponema sp.]